MQHTNSCLARQEGVNSHGYKKATPTAARKDHLAPRSLRDDESHAYAGLSDARRSAPFEGAEKKGHGQLHERRWPLTRDRRHKPSRATSPRKKRGEVKGKQGRG